MSSGKRIEGESFEDYRQRLKEEQKELKLKLQGELVWCSSAIVPSPDEKHKSTPKEERPLVKIRVQGTYKKPTGGE